MAKLEERLERYKRLREKRGVNSEIVETDVEVVSLVNKSKGKCGNQGFTQTMDYNPCRMVMKDKTYVADIFSNGNANVKGLAYNQRESLTLTNKEYVKKSEVVNEVKFGDPLKNKKWLVYGLIAVAGYFAYKKFIK